MEGDASIGRVWRVDRRPCTGHQVQLALSQAEFLGPFQAELMVQIMQGCSVCGQRLKLIATSRNLHARQNCFFQK